MANKATLKKKLDEVKAAKHELNVKIGQMSIIPRSDSVHYSSAKLENWQHEIADLNEKELELEGQLLELEGGTVEAVTPPKAQAEPAPKAQDPDLEAATKKAAKEFAQLVKRADDRAVEITRVVYRLADLLQTQEEDFKTASVLAQVNPDELSSWQIRESFPTGTLLSEMITTQKQILFVRRDLLEKANLPPVW